MSQFLWKIFTCGGASRSISRLAGRVAYCRALRFAGAWSPGLRVASCRGTPLSCLDRFFQKSLAKILFAINLQQYTLSRRSNSQDGCIHQSSYKTTPRQADRKQTVIFLLTNRNLYDIFYALKDMFFVNFYSGFTKFRTLPIAYLAVILHEHITGQFTKTVIPAAPYCIKHRNFI